MSANSGASNYPIRGLSENPRTLHDSDLTFLAEYTQKPLEALRSNTQDVWKRAKEQAFVYNCINDLVFLKPSIHAHPCYTKVLVAKEAASRHGEAKLRHMELGACFGQDVRRLLLDGFRHDQLLAVDVLSDYWDFGRSLFLDEETLKVPFLAVDATEEAFVVESHPDMGTLQGSADFVYAAKVLHCIPERGCQKLLQNVWQVLKRQGTLYGTSTGQTKAAEWTFTKDGKGVGMLYNKERLEQALQQAGFSNIVIDVHQPERYKKIEMVKQMFQLTFSAQKA